MSEGVWILAGVAASVAFVHTLAGPDHYLPFVAMSRAGRWGWRRTAAVTAACGLGHVFSSVLLGLFGVAAIAGTERLASIETHRGELAAWGLMGFGLVYAVWGLRRALRGQRHTHLHIHGDGTAHAHEHQHAADHLHAHDQTSTKPLTPWVLFTIFLFGPCEPLIPLIMAPGLKGQPSGVVLVAGIFALVTVVTMLSMVALATAGVRRISLGPLARFDHALAGLALLACGLGVRFLGL